MEDGSSLRHKGASRAGGRTVRAPHDLRPASTSDDEGRSRHPGVEPHRPPELHAPKPRTGRELLFRVWNICIAAVALVVLSPLMLLIAIAIKLDSPGPVIYRQLRVGLDRRRNRDDATNHRRDVNLGGVPFILYKFRTMTTDAEDETGPVWSDDEDSRVTRVGRILRRHRLDEIPQFWNVLKGNMSVVGPRPERPSFISYLREEIEEYPLRQKVRPGITGWAQVNREADASLEHVRAKLEYDLDYLKRRSLGFDLRIMCRTVLVMAFRDTALGNGGEEDRAERVASP